MASAGGFDRIPCSPRHDRDFCAGKRARIFEGETRTCPGLDTCSIPTLLAKPI